MDSLKEHTERQGAVMKQLKETVLVLPTLLILEVMLDALQALPG